MGMEINVAVKTQITRRRRLPGWDILQVPALSYLPGELKTGRLSMLHFLGYVGNRSVSPGSDRSQTVRGLLYTGITSTASISAEPITKYIYIVIALE